MTRCHFNRIDYCSPIIPGPAPSRDHGPDLQRPQPMRYVNGQPLSVGEHTSPMDHLRIASSGHPLAVDPTHPTDHLRMAPFGASLISTGREFGEGDKRAMKSIRTLSPRSDARHMEGRRDWWFTGTLSLKLECGGVCSPSCQIL